MKSLTTFITEQIKDWTHASEICKDFCEAGAWTHTKVSPEEVTNLYKSLKDEDFVEYAKPNGAQKVALEKEQNLIKALVSKKGVKEAYDEWKDGQSGAYWYQGYSREEKAGYEVEMTLIIAMSEYIGLNIKDCYKTTDLSYDQLKTKFLNKQFEKEMLARFKRKK